jgi:hypothetical protein
MCARSLVAVVGLVLMATLPGSPTARPAAKAQEAKPPAPLATAQPAGKHAEGVKNPAAEPLSDQDILLALAKPVKLEFHDTPLRDAIKSLEKTLGVPVQLDEKSLAESRTDLNRKVTFSLSGTSGRAGMKWLSRELDLRFFVNRGLSFASANEDVYFGHAVRRRVFRVSDLVANDWKRPERPCDLRALTELIPSTVIPDAWEDNNGPYRILPFKTAGFAALIVVQPEHGSAHDDVCEEVEELLANLRSMRHRSPDEAVIETKQPAWKEAILRALTKRVDFNLKSVPFSEAIAQLQQKLGVPVLIDRKSCAEEDVSLATPVTIAKSNMPAETVLDSLIGPMGLTWVLEDEVLLITHDDRPELTMETVLYDVWDLPAFRDKRGRGVPDGKALEDLIKSSVCPETWRTGVGKGDGIVAPFLANDIQVLAVRQDRYVHQELAGFLAELRKVRGKPPNEADIKRLPLLPRRLPAKAEAWRVTPPRPWKSADAG